MSKHNAGEGKGILPFTNQLAALGRAQRLHPVIRNSVENLEAPKTSLVVGRTKFCARDLRIVLLGFEKVFKGQPEIDAPVRVIFDGTLVCKVTGVHYEGGIGLMIEAGNDDAITA